MIGAKTVKAWFLFGICDISDQILMASSTRTRTSKDMDRVIKMAYNNVVDCGFYKMHNG
jgi:hypothetical protein